jgi:hypothetical protein
VEAADVLVGRRSGGAAGDPAHAEGGDGQADQRCQGLHPERLVRQGVQQAIHRDAVDGEHDQSDQHSGQRGEQEGLVGAAGYGTRFCLPVGWQKGVRHAHGSRH